MKSMLYVGAALMISATIYGFVDLKKSNNAKEFKNLYQETPPQLQAKTSTVTPTDVEVKGEQKEMLKSAEPSRLSTPAKTERKKTRKEIGYKKFSRSALREEIVMDSPRSPAANEPKEAEKTEPK
jgi:hypothetical protein